MAVKIKYTGDIVKEGIKFLLYGKSGIGKTKLLGTIPNNIVIATEDGLLSLKEENLPYIEVNTVDDIYDALKFVKGRRGRKYTTVSLDSITDIAEIVLSDYKATMKDGRAVYGELNDEMVKLIRKFKKIKKNVIFVAKRKRIEDDGIQKYVPGMPGRSLVDGLPFFFDEVIYMDLQENEDGEMERVLRTDVDIEYEAKDRSGNLDPIEKPNLKRILRKISR